MWKRFVNQILKEVVRGKGDFAVPAYLNTFAGIDVYTFSFADGDDLECAKSFDFNKLVLRQSLFDDFEKSPGEIFCFFFRDAFFFSKNVGYFL